MEAVSDRLFKKSKHDSNSLAWELEKYSIEAVEPLGSDPLLYWKSRSQSFLKLARVARVALAIPASSAPSERLFSDAGQVISDRRSRLQGSTVAAVLFLESHFLNN
jgi:hypothetical protein